LEMTMMVACNERAGTEVHLPDCDFLN
jgi:hypothetical protein